MGKIYGCGWPYDGNLYHKDIYKLNTTTVDICGIQFEINWTSDGKIGTDQHGNEWADKDNPYLIDEDVMDKVLDQVNELKAKLK